MSEQNKLIIDDRKTGNLHASSGNEWQLVTDGVMGGVSNGQLLTEIVEDRACLKMQGDVNLDNNGGFIQITLNPSNDILEKITEYSGLFLEVYGNDQAYNVHLRTKDLWLPWQSYRATFSTKPQWETLYFPFSEFKPYRTESKLDVDRLSRVGIVAIGRVFTADLCVAKIGIYKK